MKHLLPVIGLFLSVQLIAQAPVKEGEPVDLSDIKAYPGAQNSRKTDVETNYYWRQALSNFTTLSGYRTSIYPDSTVKQVYGDGEGGITLGYAGLHAMGQTVDFKSIVWDQPFSKFTDYTVDSVGIPIIYNKFTETNDTLLIQFYKDDGLRRGFVGGEEYYSFNYRYKVNMGGKSFKDIKYALTWEDTTSQFAWLTLPLGESFTDGQPFGISVSYIPAEPANVGDTLFDSRFNPYKKVNHLQISYTDDPNQYSDAPAYNTGATVPTSVRYNTNDNGWNSKFIPGIAWIDFNRHYSFRFYVRAQNVGKEENWTDKSGIYPNPNNGQFNLSQSLLEQADQLFVYDMSGRLVFNEQVAQGQGTVDVSSLEQGSYMLKLEGADFQTTIPFLIK